MAKKTTTNKKNVHYGKKRVASIKRLHRFGIVMAVAVTAVGMSYLWAHDHNQQQAAIARLQDDRQITAMAEQADAQAQVETMRQEKAAWDRLPPPRL